MSARRKIAKDLGKPAACAEKSPRASGRRRPAAKNRQRPREASGLHRKIAKDLGKAPACGEKSPRTSGSLRPAAKNRQGPREGAGPRRKIAKNFGKAPVRGEKSPRTSGRRRSAAKRRQKLRGGAGPRRKIAKNFGEAPACGEKSPKTSRGRHGAPRSRETSTVREPTDFLASIQYRDGTKGGAECVAVILVRFRSRGMKDSGGRASSTPSTSSAPRARRAHHPGRWRGAVGPRPGLRGATRAVEAYPRHPAALGAKRTDGARPPTVQARPLTGSFAAPRLAHDQAQRLRPTWDDVAPPGPP